MKSYSKYRNEAVVAAKKAGELLSSLLPANCDLNSDERLQLMDSADRKVHDCLLQTLLRSFPDHSYISVYTENPTFFTDRPLWVLDPIVGLGNFSHGDPHFAISIALMLNGVTVTSVIHNPVFGELFSAEKGQGAFLNNRPISVSVTNELKHSLLATRFPYDIREAKRTNLELFNTLILKAEGVLNHGSATLDLAYVASGRYDGFWAIHMNPWDLTAAVLLIEEAGGMVSTLSGEDYFTESVEILATNGKIHQEVLKTVEAVVIKKQKTIS